MMRVVLNLVIVVGLATCGVADAAELRLKAQARCSMGIVRLGDIADIHAAEPWQHEQLASIELGPAPATGGRRFLRAREVQDALFMRGINLAEHRLSGSERIEVIGPGEPVVAPVVEPRPSAPPAPRIDDAARDRAKRRIVEAIVECLNQRAGSRQPWQVTVEATDEQLAPLFGTPSRIVADGGMEPWIGSQRFTIVVQNNAVSAPISIDAKVSLPVAVATIVRNLSPGTILHASDVVLKPTAKLNDGLQPFYRLEDVVGLEITTSLPAGAVLGRNMLRRPVVVRRGEAVTLYARAAGLRVRTTARAREDGGLGDLVAVESLNSREAFYARVTGIQEVEIYAAPAEAAPSTVSVQAADAKFGTPEGFRR